MQDHAQIGLRITETVDRRHRRDDDRVGPLEQGLRRGQAHLLDVFVDGSVLLDESVGSRNVGLRLVIIVVGNEVLDGVLREEGLELAIQLRRQGLVVGEHQRGSLHLLDDVRDREGLAGARDAQQRLVSQAALQPVDEFFDRLGLVAGGRVICKQFEAHGEIIAWVSA